MEQPAEKILTAISTRSSELGFAEFGIIQACEADLTEQSRYLNALNEGFYADMHYLARNIEKRFNPALLVEGTQSILVFLAPYGEKEVPGIASYALGEDYHITLKDKLHTLLQELPRLAGLPEETKESSSRQKSHGRVFTDSAPILERFWAVKAGLGFIGKNNFLISPRSGIKTLIGVIFTSIALPVTPPVPDKKYCGNCTRCLEACPTGALCAPYTLDARKCISYQTIENKALPLAAAAGDVPGEVTEEVTEGIPGTPSRPQLAGWYFGCDACLNACPWNSRNLPGWPEFSTRYNLLTQADAGWWEKLSGEEFRTLFAGSPLLRGGLENIRAALALNTTDTNA